LQAAFFKCEITISRDRKWQAKKYRKKISVGD
jgi:hypothetical protein